MMTLEESGRTFPWGKVDILGLQVDAQPFDDAVARLIEWSHSTERRYVCTCTVNEVMSSRNNAALKQAINQADMATSDGMPLVWVMRRWGYSSAQRVYGPDMMRALFRLSTDGSIRHYFFGGLPGVPEQLVEKLHAQYPGLAVAGTYAPPVQPIEERPDPLVVERLNNSGADIIWVGLGGAKQNLWMSLYRSELTVPLLIGVGAAFDFLSGTKKQAPPWIQRNGLEWLFRLVSEPGRLWYRYLVYNPQFVWHILKQSLQRNH